MMSGGIGRLVVLTGLPRQRQDNGGDPIGRFLTGVSYVP